MAKVRYRLFGQEYTESQGRMMARVFEQLLTRHPERAAEAAERFGCLCEGDYSRDLQAFKKAPSAFLNKTVFQVGEQIFTVGTSCSMKQKLSHIQRLCSLCGEEPVRFLVLEDNAAAPNAGPERPSGSSRRRNRVRYRFLGREFCSNQSEMLYTVFAEILYRKRV